MRNVLASVKSILRKAAALALVPVQVIVDGVRTILWHPSPLADQALDMIDEEVPAAAADDACRLRDAGSRLPAAKVRRAAELMLQREPVPASVLDPAFGGERQYLDWLKGLSRAQLATMVAMPRDMLDRHLNGVRSLPGVPLMSDRDETPQPKGEVLALTPSDIELRRLRAEARTNYFKRAA